MDLETITQKIAKADESKLNRQVDDMVKPFDALLRNGQSYTVLVGGKTEVVWWHALEALKKAAVDINLDRAKQAAVDEFMRKVDSIQSQLDELREEAL